MAFLFANTKNGKQCLFGPSLYRYKSETKKKNSIYFLELNDIQISGVAACISCQLIFLEIITMCVCIHTNFSSRKACPLNGISWEAVIKCLISPLQLNSLYFGELLTFYWDGHLALHSATIMFVLPSFSHFALICKDECGFSFMSS